MKFLIVNADDFGYSHGITRGIAEAHTRGVLTSTGLMVNTPATMEAVRMCADLPQLSIGLHVNFTNEAQRLVEFDSPRVCRDELRRQFDRFVDLMKRLPTHIDSHQHVHRHPGRAPFFLALAEEYHIPLRDYCGVCSVGGFYAQWEYGVSNPDYVSFDVFSRIVTHELPHGVSELGCHPGYFDPDFECVYHRDREFELKTLCDLRARELLTRANIELIGYCDVAMALNKIAGCRNGSADGTGRREISTGRDPSGTANCRVHQS
jgi:predicted glycoside hydrolase/deacetylase ChbG (UPF0249 family)